MYITSTCLEISYETFVKPVQGNFPVVELDDVSRIDALAKEMAEAKMIEAGYQVDNGNLINRIKTGLYGEAALGKMLGVDLIDWEVGPSSHFNVGDLKKIGLDLGVKTVEYWKFPLIHINPVRPEVILLRHGLRFLVCGLYTPEVMRSYSTRDFVIDPRVRNTKTAFYGIPFYRSFRTLQDLERICGKLPV